MSVENISIPVKLKSLPWICASRSQTFLDVTPWKTPISRKFLGFLFNISFKKIPGYEESVKQKFLRELISLLRIYNNIKLTKNESLKNNWNPKKKGINYLFYTIIEFLSVIFKNRYNFILNIEKIYYKSIDSSSENHKLLLENFKPDVIFNTHQRSLVSIPIISAAKKMKIRNKKKFWFD